MSTRPSSPVNFVRRRVGPTETLDSHNRNAAVAGNKGATRGKPKLVQQRSLKRFHASMRRPIGKCVSLSRVAYADGKDCCAAATVRIIGDRPLGREAESKMIDRPCVWRQCFVNRPRQRYSAARYYAWLPSASTSSGGVVVELGRVYSFIFPGEPVCGLRCGR